MQTFIDQVASFLIENHREDFEKICIVFPNRRARLYLKKSLGKLIDKPVWLPDIISIEDFVQKLTGLAFIDPVYLQFELYKVYSKIEVKAADSFDEFINWGEVVLQDFNELDLAIAEAEKVFSFLNQDKAMALWNPDGTPLTDFQVRYLQFYNNLFTYYSELKTILLDKGEVYSGLAYRRLAEQVSGDNFLVPWEKIIFAGFNALNNAEKKITSVLVNTGKAVFLWDADRYYLDDPIQEAGKFLRINRKLNPDADFRWTGNYFREIPKEIEVIGVPQNVGQVKLAGEILDENSGKIDPDDTTIILNDEYLLMPLLNSLPESIGEFNVTMGLPLVSTSLFRFVDHFLTMHENALKLKRAGGGEQRFYYLDVLKIIEDPWFQKIESGNNFSQATQELVNKISVSNQFFLTTADLDNFSNDFFKNRPELSSAFKPFGNQPERAIAGISRLLDLLKTQLIRESEQNDSFHLKLDLEYIFRLKEVFNHLDRLTKAEDLIGELGTFRKIFNQIARSRRIPFYGEPLKGLQVMGMLESRNLDFKNVIMLSVNEDTLPAAKPANSFIPFDIKLHFGLPVYRDHNAVFAYHFYRVLQRAEKVFLLYNTEPGALGGGERSRFIMQLIQELPKFRPESTIHEQVLTNPPEIESDEPLQVPKSDDIMLRLDGLASAGFSATSLNTYRRCSLQFYLQYVAGIGEKEEPEETIEASTLGSVVHEVLYKLYHPFKEKQVQPVDVKEMIDHIEPLLNEAFNKYYPGGDITAGKNLLIVKVAEAFLMKFLKQEADFLESSGEILSIKSLEQKYDAEFLHHDRDHQRKIRLRGKFDRVDRLGSLTRIIDYKTGKTENRDLKFNDWEELLTEPGFDKCFQLLFYYFIYKSNPETKNENVVPGILSFRNLSAGFLMPNFPGDPDHEEINREFSKVLKQLFDSIFDQTVPFVQTTDEKVCEYCPYKSFCNR